MKTSFFNRKNLPLVLEPEDDGEQESAARQSLSNLCLERRDTLHESLRQFGALLFRGYGISDAGSFEQVVRWFSGKDLLDYVGGASPRIKLGGGVYTSTEYPSHYTLSLHNELSYTHSWPQHLYFCCVTASEQGGETPLGDSRELLRSIDGEVVGRFKSRKIRYVRNFHGGTGAGSSWRTAFETNDKSIIENYCREGGIEFHWREDGGLRTSQVCAATATHPETGEEVWFNQADGFHPSGMDAQAYRTLMLSMKEEELPLNAYFGDGSHIPASMLAHVREVMWREKVVFPWQPGDVLILDNMLTAHGRMPFCGPRKILLAMT